MILTMLVENVMLEMLASAASYGTDNVFSDKTRNNMCSQSCIYCINISSESEGWHLGFEFELLSYYMRFTEMYCPWLLPKICTNK